MICSSRVAISLKLKPGMITFLLVVTDGLVTDTSLSIEFMNNVMQAKVELSDIDVIHEVPSKRKDGKRVVVVALNPLLSGHFSPIKNTTGYLPP